MGQLLESLFEDFELSHLILDENGDVRTYSRVAANGRFSYLLGDMDTPDKNGVIIALI
jgi:hypothetical protein